MDTTQDVIGIASEKGPEPFAVAAPPTEDDAELPRPRRAGRNNVSAAGRKTRVKVAVIYALTTVIPLLVMFYIIQANLFLRSLYLKFPVYLRGYADRELTRVIPGCQRLWDYLSRRFHILDDLINGFSDTSQG